MEHKAGIYEKYIKRVLDIICALLALIVFWWLYVLIAILVKVKLGSPVLFKQQRPGKFNITTGEEVIFDFYKFRTMTNEKDEKGQLLPNEERLTSFGKLLRSKQTGGFGDYNAISFNGNKIITGPSGGMLLTDDKEAANKVRKWSTQSREDAAWYQHEELGYNYRMSNVIAGVVRGQFPYLEEHISQKKAIYMRYKKGLKDLPIMMSPYDEVNSEPNFWLSSMIIDKDAMCRQVRGEKDALYVSEPGKSCPTEILEALANMNAEGRPIWKPMHMQPIYRNSAFITTIGNG